MQNVASLLMQIFFYGWRFILSICEFSTLWYLKFPLSTQWWFGRSLCSNALEFAIADGLLAYNVSQLCQQIP